MSERSAVMAPPQISQSAARIMMIDPVVVFGFNDQTRLTNIFQQHVQMSSEQVHVTARRKWQDSVNTYRDVDVPVEVYQSLDPRTPDAIYPNSVSTFPGPVFGQDKPVAVLHPMLCENRRLERSDALVKFIRDLGYDIRDDLLEFEIHDKAFEGTGSAVMDHVNKVVYCALSDRSDPDVAKAFAGMIGYDLETYNTFARDYHTDLIQNINTGFMAIAACRIVDQDRPRILDRLASTGREIVELTDAQFNAYAGNALEVRDVRGHPVYASSHNAFLSLDDKQRSQIRNHIKNHIHPEIDLIEKVGGGSQRCLTQELHGLPAPGG